MGHKGRIAADIRQQIISRIKNDGVTVAEASREHGVSIKTIYVWLSSKAEAPSHILQINKLKRENEDLKRLLGQALLESERSKKKNPYYAV